MTLIWKVAQVEAWTAKAPPPLNVNDIIRKYLDKICATSAAICICFAMPDDEVIFNVRF